jgi:ketosteroid isomerase-like protein
MKCYRNLLAILLVAGAFQTLAGCSPAKPVTDPMDVTKAVFTAINNNQAEVAASYFADDAEFTAAFGQPTGKAKILGFFKTTVIPYKMHLEIAEVSAVGDDVTGTFTLKDISSYKTETNMELTAVITNGKIKSMTWSLKK